MKVNENTRLEGLRGTWYCIDERMASGTMFYLFESEQHGDEVPAVLTDDKLNVIDTVCYSGIYQALLDNILVPYN